MGQSIYNMSWIAASLGTISLVLTLVVFPMAYQAVRMLEAEIELEKEGFKIKSDSLWKQIMEQRPAVGTIAKRQVVQLRASCANGQKPLTRDNGLAVLCNKKDCPDGSKCEQKVGFKVCCPIVLKDETAESSGPPDFCNCASENSCPLGPPGPNGEGGEDGQPGKPGSDGEPGLDGGDAEISGPGCEACPAGAPGRPGEDGIAGRPGESGSPGAAGRPGLTGRPGVNGNNGPPGEAGPDGKPGSDGDSGSSGAKNVPGPPGEKGPPGPDGSPGDRAPAGKPGVDGKPGITGRPGESGEDGTPGRPGAPGRPGEDGDIGNDAQYCKCPLRSVGTRNLKIIRVKNA